MMIQRTFPNVSLSHSVVQNLTCGGATARAKSSISTVGPVPGAHNNFKAHKNVLVSLKIGRKKNE